MKKKEFLEVVLLNKISGYLRSGLGYDMDYFWSRVYDLLSFKLGDHFEVISEILKNSKPDKNYPRIVCIFEKMVRYKRINVAKIMIDKFYEVHTDSIRFVLIKHNSVELMEYLMEISLIEMIFDDEFLYISKKMYSVIEPSLVDDGHNMYGAIKHGATHIIKSLKKKGHTDIPLRINLVKSNVDCVKYLDKHYGKINNFGYFNPKILLNEECIKILELEHDLLVGNLVYPKYELRIMKRFLTRETRDRFNIYDLLYRLSDYGCIEGIKYVCSIYEFDYDIIQHIASAGRYAYKLIPYLRSGELVWKDEYKIHLPIIVQYRKNIRLLKYLGNRITNEDMNTKEIYASVISDKFLGYILENYKVNYSEFMQYAIRCCSQSKIYKFFDKIWDPEINWENFINHSYEISVCKFWTKKRIELRDDFFGRGCFSMEGVILGGIPKKEVMYKYVSVLECKFPELLEDPILRRISVWHSGRSMRMKNCPGDILFHFL